MDILEKEKELQKAMDEVLDSTLEIAEGLTIEEYIKYLNDRYMKDQKEAWELQEEIDSGMVQYAEKKQAKKELSQLNSRLELHRQQFQWFLFYLEQMKMTASKKHVADESI